MGDRSRGGAGQADEEGQHLQQLLSSSSVCSTSCPESSCTSKQPHAGCPSHALAGTPHAPASGAAPAAAAAAQTQPATNGVTSKQAAAAAAAAAGATEGDTPEGRARTAGARRRGTWQRRLGRLGRAIWDSGAACMSISAFVFSVSALLVKLTHDRVPTFEIVAWRSSLSFIACAIGAHKAGIRPLFGKRQNYGYLLGRGICGASAMTTYYLSIASLPLADAVTLFFLNPAVTALAAWLLLNEPLGLVGGAGCLVSMGGLVMLAQPPFLFHAGENWDHTRLVGTGFGVVSALCAAGAFIFIRLVGKGEQALCMSVWFHTCAFVTSVLPLACGIPEWPVLPSLLDTGLLVGVAATSFWGQILIGRGFQLLNAARASAINFTQVVYSYVWGMALLGESLSLLGMLGSLLIAAGVLMVNTRNQQKAQAAADNGEPKHAGQGTDSSGGLQDLEGGDRAAGGDAHAAMRQGSSGQPEQLRAVQLSELMRTGGPSSPGEGEKQPLLQANGQGQSDAAVRPDAFRPALAWHGHVDLQPAVQAPEQAQSESAPAGLLAGVPASTEQQATPVHAAGAAGVSSDPPRASSNTDTGLAGVQVRVTAGGHVVVDLTVTSPPDSAGSGAPAEAVAGSGEGVLRAQQPPLQGGGIWRPERQALQGDVQSGLRPSPFSLAVACEDHSVADHAAQCSMVPAAAAEDGDWARPLLLGVSSQQDAGHEAVQDDDEVARSIWQQESGDVLSPQRPPVTWHAFARMMGHLDSRVRMAAPDLSRLTSNTSSGRREEPGGRPAPS